MAARPPASHAGNMGSIPVPTTKKEKYVNTNILNAFSVSNGNIRILFCAVTSVSSCDRDL